MRRPLPPSRTRRIAKWTGLVVCALFAVTWAANTVIDVTLQRPPFAFTIVDGLLQFYWSEFIVSPDSLFTSYWHSFDVGVLLPNGQSLAREFVYVNMPLWMLLTLAAIPTAILWRRDRRTVKPGCFRQCGYDLRASKKTCPECGTPFAPEPRKSIAMRRTLPTSHGATGETGGERS